MKNKKFISICFLMLVFSTCFLFAKSQMQPVSSEWKIKFGDDKSWAFLPFSNVSSWENVELPGAISVVGKSEFFWLKTKIEIPQSLQNQLIYLELGLCPAALEVYVDDIRMATHGTIEPKVNISHVSNTLAHIPASAIKNGYVEISIRCRAGASHVTFGQFYIVDNERYYNTFLYQSFLNTTVYNMMAAICFVLGLYFLFQFITNKQEKASCSFSITLFTISVYFFDIATKKTFIPFIWQLTISRLCLTFSVGSLVIFIKQFFKQPYKKLRRIAIVVFIFVTSAFFYSTQNSLLNETVFTISLLPIFVGLIYLYIVVIKAVFARQKNARKILLGITIGLIFGIHDVVYQVQGAVPFAWLQGFSFFFIDITMFFVVAVENIQNKKRIDDFITTTSMQKDKLNEVLEAASKLSAETMEISAALDSSVLKVAESVDLSIKEAKKIGNFIEKQNDAVKNTSTALGYLVESVRTVNEEVSNETAVMSETVKETQSMIDGVNQVTDVISSAAEFSSSLGVLTKESTDDVAHLVEAMESIKNSSGEILGVVEIVTDFAQRTNMLAMNASIEAAHAGVSGKGFAVIAHEIKTLAGASSSQADKIKDIVTVIDSNIGRSFDLSLRVKEVLGKVSQEAVDSSRKINESVQNMQAQQQAGKRISEATAIMSASARKVKEETNQQYGFSNQASSNMNELTEVAKSAREAVIDINNRNNVLSEQTDALKKLARRAKDASEGLNELITK